MVRNVALLPLVLSGALALGQNLPPVVTITAVSVDEGAGSVALTYDLFDAEGDVCEVRFRASLDGGMTFGADVSMVTGDVGTSIQPGTGRSVAWNATTVPDLSVVVVQVIAEDGQAPDVQAMVDAVDAQRLEASLQQLATPRHHSSHPAGLNAVRDTILQRFQTYDLQTTTQEVPFAGTQYPNVIGRHTGLHEEPLTILVDAHYDGVSNSPGADDNASGVVATLEAARILSQYRFRKSIRFIGFSFEEQGLVGSGRYVQAGIPAWETIAGVLNLEMIGFYSDAPNSQSLPNGFEILFPAAVADLQADEFRGNFLTVVGNTASQGLQDSFLLAMSDHVPELRRVPLTVPGNGQIAPDLRRSDHARFWDAGIPALMLTDGSEFRNPFYHTPNDTPAIIDLPFLTRCTKAVIAAAARLAEPVHAGSDMRALAPFTAVEHHHALGCTPELFPNPAEDVLHIKLSGCAPRKITARLFDLQGRSMTGRDVIMPHGEGTVHLGVAGIPAGRYMLVLQAGEASSMHPVQIIR